MYRREWLDWIELTHNRTQKQSVTKLARNLQVSWETASFLGPAEHLDKNGCPSYSCAPVNCPGGRYSSIGIATHYELGGSGFEPWWGGGWDFSHQSISSPRPTQPPARWIPWLLPGVKRPGRGVDHQPQPSIELEERVDCVCTFSLCVHGMWTLPSNVW